MTRKSEYDVAIVGGGLAGLAASILLARQGFSVVVFEKEHYPFHKVCGEYISMESRGFLEGMGIPVPDLRLPVIEELVLTAPNGRAFRTTLPLGGFGISRHKLDAMLAQIARHSGVEMKEGTKVMDVLPSGEAQKILIRSPEAAGQVEARICLGAYGKKSNLDTKWRRAQLPRAGRSSDNYVAVKYHIRTSWPGKEIGLHNFQGGYCGISAIEDGLFCLCYLTTARNLRRSANSVEIMEKEILCRNPWLKNIWNDREVCAGFPVTISQVDFRAKTQVEKGTLLLGDAAGMITPLCGNGMSIALHTAKIAAGFAADFLHKKLDRQKMEETYQREWRQQFHSRLRRGRLLQKFFGQPQLSNFFVLFFKTFPFLARPVVKMTHGKPF